MRPEIINSLGNKKTVFNPDIRRGIEKGYITGRNDEGVYVLNSRLNTLNSKLISVDDEAGSVRKAMHLAFGRSIYNNHYYIYCQRTIPEKRGKVFRVNSGEMTSMLKCESGCPIDSEVFVSANPLKRKYISKVAFGTLDELGADLKTYVVRDKGRYSANIKYCNANFFSCKNIVIRLEMYKKGEDGSYTVNDSLINGFKNEVNKLIDSGCFVCPNIVNFHEAACELWYCTEENSIRLSWLYNGISERLMNMVNFHVAGIRISDGTTSLRLRASLESMPYLFGSISPELTVSDTIILKNRLYDIDILKQETGYELSGNIVTFKDEKGHVEKLKGDGPYATKAWKHFLYERKAVLEELLEYEHELVSEYSYREISDFHKRLCYLHFSTMAGICGAEKAMEYTREFNNRTIYSASKEYLEEFIFAPALSTEKQHFYFKTETFIKELGILGEDKYNEIKTRLLFSISSTARSRRCRERKKELKRKAEEKNEKRMALMYFRTGNLEKAAKTCGYTRDEADRILRNNSRYEATYHRMRIYGARAFRRKIYAAFIRLNWKTMGGKVIDNAAVIAEKYKCPVEYVYDTVMYMQELMKDIGLSYEKSLDVENYILNPVYDGKTLVIPKEDAERAEKFGCTLSSGIVRKIMMVVGRSKSFLNKYGRKFLDIQIAIAPHLRLMHDAAENLQMSML